MNTSLKRKEGATFFFVPIPLRHFPGQPHAFITRCQDIALPLTLARLVTMQIVPTHETDTSM